MTIPGGGVGLPRAVPYIRYIHIIINAYTFMHISTFMCQFEEFIAAAVSGWGRCLD